jgi:hypothetical protein
MTLSYLVDAPVEAVFRYLANPAMAFADVTPRMSIDPGGPVRLGDILTVTAPGLKEPWQLEVVELVPLRKVTFRMFGTDQLGAGSTASYELQPAGDRTRVAGSMHTQLAGRLGLGARLMKPVIWVQARRGNRKIAAAIERRYRADELT